MPHLYFFLPISCVPRICCLLVCLLTVHISRGTSYEPAFSIFFGFVCVCVDWLATGFVYTATIQLLRNISYHRLLFLIVRVLCLCEEDAGDPPESFRYAVGCRRSSCVCGATSGFLTGMYDMIRGSISKSGVLFCATHIHTWRYLFVVVWSRNSRPHDVGLLGSLSNASKFGNHYHNNN